MYIIRGSRSSKGLRKERKQYHIPATVRTWRRFSPWTRNTTLRWVESTLAFSNKKTRSTPYSWSRENLTKSPTGPARSCPMTKFFFPRTCNQGVQPPVTWDIKSRGTLLTPSRRANRSLRALSLKKSASDTEFGAMAAVEHPSTAVVETWIEMDCCLFDKRRRVDEKRREVGRWRIYYGANRIRLTATQPRTAPYLYCHVTVAEWKLHG